MSAETPEPNRFPRGALLALSVIVFVALVIFGLGMTSLLLDQEVIATPGISPVPGAVAVAVAGIGFGVTLWAAFRADRPTYWAALWAAVVVVLAHLASLWLTALITGTTVAVATGVVGDVLLGWVSPVIAAAAFVTAWGAVAIARTAASRPRWPWEDET